MSKAHAATDSQPADNAKQIVEFLEKETFSILRRSLVLSFGCVLAFVVILVLYARVITLQGGETSFMDYFITAILVWAVLRSISLAISTVKQYKYAKRLQATHGSHLMAEGGGHDNQD